MIILPESLKKFLFLLLWQQHLTGAKVLKQLVEIFERAFGSEKFPCGNIQKRCLQVALAKMYGTKKIIRFALQHLVIHRHPGSDQLGHASFHDALGRFGVFKLITNSNPLPCLYKFR